MKGLACETPSGGMWRRWPTTTNGANDAIQTTVHTIRASKARVFALRFRAPNRRRGRRWRAGVESSVAVVRDNQIVCRGRNHIVEEETVGGARERIRDRMIVGDFGGAIVEVE